MSKTLEEWADEWANKSFSLGEEDWGTAFKSFLRRLLREVCGKVIEHAADERDKDAVRSPYGIGCNCCGYAYAKLEEICGEEVE